MMKTRLSIVIAVLAACGGGEDEATGEETSPCLEGKCLGTLECLSNLCVDPEWEVPDDSQSSTGREAEPSDDDEGDDTETPDSDDSSGADIDNAAACQALVDGWECPIPAGTLRCEDFDLSPCDLAEYFECLADNSTCQGTMLDVSQWGTCATLASCS